MDKKTIIGFIDFVLIFLGFFYVAHELLGLTGLIKPIIPIAIFSAYMIYIRKKVI